MPLSLGFLNPYPPGQHGLDTFALSLADQLAAIGQRTGIVHMVDGRTPRPRLARDRTAHLVDIHDRTSIAAAALAAFDVAIVQYEFGFQRGVQAAMVGAVADRLTVPMIVVAHAACTQVTSQCEVFRRMLFRAAAVVTPSDAVRRQLICDYGAAPATVVVIPHATPVRLPATAGRAFDEPPTILTWGLLAPGVGIESMIDAMTTLRHLEPVPRYMVAGPTHPKVLARQGEAYRHRLMARTIDRDVAHLVNFRAAHLTGTELSLALAQADVVALPYEKSCAQEASEVLADTVVAGRPVVATAFSRAIQLLSGGAGIVVPHDDPAAFTDALRRVLTQPDLAATMSRRAIGTYPERAWPAVARRFQRLAEDVLANRLPTAV